MTRAQGAAAATTVVFALASILASVHAAENESASPTPSASASYSALAPGAITAAETRKLLGEYRKAQTAEIKALDHRQRIELKELKVAQNQFYKDWAAKETVDRHKYFAEHTTGPEKRAYLQDFKSRRESLFKIQVDEKAARIQEQKARVEAVRADQAMKLKDFEEALAKGLRPSVELWPSGSR